MQEQSSSGGKTSYKLYAWVGVVYAPDGVMEPKYLKLSPTGEKYMIDRVYRRQRSASRKAGGSGAHVLRRTFATGEFLKGADVKSIANYIGDLETTTSQYYISVKNNIRIGGKIMNVAPLPHLVKASGQN